MKKELFRTNKQNIICLFVALIHLFVTLITDRLIFTFPEKGSAYYTTAIVDFVICLIICYIVLFFFYRMIYILIFDKTEKKERAKGIVLSALPYLLIVVVVLAIKLPKGFISNDEYAIYSNAISLTHDTWFNYLTTYYYIVSLMLIPFKYGPVIVKALIQLYAVGYVIYRMKKYFGQKPGMWGYILFLLYPVIAYIASAHRLPIYFLIYLMLFVKLLFDGLEGSTAAVIEDESGKNNSRNYSTIFLILLMGAILTQWRTEGIYLLVLIPILCLFVYPYFRSWKNLAIMLLIYLGLQYVISIPQTGFTADNIDAAANDRMKPFYAYTITNMYRNGLDMTKNAEDMAIVDKYLAIEVIEAINDYYEDINYEDVLILYKDGFVGVRPEATVEDFINYSDALKRIFVNNPDVFVRTRIGAFDYAARPFHIIHEGNSPRQLLSTGISIVKTGLYNLYIPTAIVVLLFLYSLIRRRWYSFFLFGGLIAHELIVFVLAPASYFKYYFPIYIMAYFYLIAIAIWAYLRRKGQTLKSPLM